MILDWQELDNRKAPAWFRNSKFGIFIHWGVYSVPAWRGINDKIFGSYAEWYYASVYGDYENHDPNFHKDHYGENFEYRDFAKDFNAELFNPEEWANLFKKAGAKYVVLTSKHHDGYCMWPTENKHKKNWRVTDIGPKVDILGSLSDEVRKQGLRMGLYYSIVDWETNWSHRASSGYFVPEKDRKKYGISEDLYADEILIPQLKEVVNKYKPSVIFSDGGEWDLTEEYTRTKEFLSWLYLESPVKDEVVVNDRFYKGMPGQHGDYFSTEYNDIDRIESGRLWEESRGIGKSYGFNRAEDIEEYRTSSYLIKELVRVVSNDGNLLLNVGPTADGRIPVIQQERLLEIGNWLSKYGDTIFETEAYYEIEGYYSTIKNNLNNKEINIFIDLENFEDEVEINKIKGFEEIEILNEDIKNMFEIKETEDKIFVKQIVENVNLGEYIDFLILKMRCKSE